MYAQYMYSNLLWQKQPSPPPTHTHRMCALTNLLSSLVLDQQIYRLHQQHPWNTGDSYYHQEYLESPLQNKVKTTEK